VPIALIVALVVVGLLLAFLTYAYRVGARMFPRPVVETVPIVEVESADPARLDDVGARLGLTVEAAARVHWGPDFVEEIVWLMGSGNTWAEVRGENLTWVSAGHDGRAWFTVPATVPVAVAARMQGWLLSDPPQWNQVVVAQDLEAAKESHERRVQAPEPCTDVETWLRSLDRRVQQKAAQAFRGTMWELSEAEGLSRPTWRWALCMVTVLPLHLLVTRATNLRRFARRGDRPLTF
jgi:hypothetical protein